MAAIAPFIHHLTPTHFPSSASKNLIFTNYYYSRRRTKSFSPPAVTSLHEQPPDLDYLKAEFGGQGVTFDAAGDSYIAKLKLQNGSKATMMLPSGLITSYKPRMWHGGTVELLHTVVMEDDGTAHIRGGLSPAFGFEKEDGSRWSPDFWSLQSIRGDPESIEVELLSKEDDMMEVRYTVILREDLLCSEIEIANTNLKPLAVNLKGSFTTHLTVSSPEATFAFGMEGSDFKTIPLVPSTFSLVPPGLEKVFDFKEMEGEEDENYKNLGDEMSRVYTNAPTFFTVIDRGRRNSVSVGRDGLEEVCIFSPGSSFESYGMFSFICIGQSALLKQIVLHPGKVMKFVQHLQNPNL